MKNKKILGLLTLASCVILGGCGPTEEEPPAPAVEIALVDLPSAVEVDSVLDLEEFVTLTNATTYTVTLDAASEGLATVDGHKVTFTGEGQVTLHIASGEEVKDVTITSSSKVRVGLINALGNAGKNYTALGLDSGDTILHRDNYILTDQWAPGAVCGGFVKFDKPGVYYTTFYVDSETEELAVDYDEQIWLDDYLDYYNGNFGVDFSTLERSVESGVDEETGEAYKEEFFKISGKEAVNFAENSLFAPRGKWTFYTDATYTETIDLTATSIWFTMDDIDFTDAEGAKTTLNLPVALVFGAPESVEGTEEVEEGYLMSYVLTADEDFVGDPDIDALLAKPENQPVGSDWGHYPGLEAASFFSAPADDKSDVMVVDYGWYDSTDPENPVAIEAPEDVAGTIFEGIKSGSSTTYFASNTIATQAGPVMEGIINHDNVVYDFAINLATEQGQVAPNAEVTDIYESAYASFGELANVESEIYNDELFFLAADPVIQGQYIMQVVLGLNPYRSDAFIAELFNLNADLAEINAVAESYAPRGDLYAFFEGMVVVMPAYGMIVIQLSLRWDETTSYDITFQIGYSAQVNTAIGPQIDQMLFPAQPPVEG